MDRKSIDYPAQGNPYNNMLFITRFKVPDLKKKYIQADILLAAKPSSI